MGAAPFRTQLQASKEAGLQHNHDTGRQQWMDAAQQRNGEGQVLPAASLPEEIRGLGEKSKAAATTRLHKDLLPGEEPNPAIGRQMRRWA